MKTRRSPSTGSPSPTNPPFPTRSPGDAGTSSGTSAISPPPPSRTRPSPITIDRFDGALDRYYQKFLLVDGFTPVGDVHWVDDFSGLSYQTVTDHGFQPPRTGRGQRIDRRWSLSNDLCQGIALRSPVDNPNQEINGTKTRYLHARVRMTGYTGSATSITAGMFSTASGVSPTNAPFVPDGSWQILHFDMADRSRLGRHMKTSASIYLTISAVAADFLDATLEVDWIAASNDPAYDGTGKLGGYEIKYDFEIDRLKPHSSRRSPDARASIPSRPPISPPSAPMSASST